MNLKKYSLPILFSTLSLTAFLLLAACQQAPQQEQTAAARAEGIETITILQTADIHGQLPPHQEFFIEGGEFRFKERGGVAHIQTIFKQVKAQNPGGTVIVDGGDLIQGSAIAALTEGAVLVR